MGKQANQTEPAGQNLQASKLRKQWANLKWENLEAWAGSGSTARGRTYQRGQHVRDLAVAEDGSLLATVLGSDRYAVHVGLEAGTGKTPELFSQCTCPIGGRCKHAVAAIAEYLQAIADNRDVPSAEDDDPRWQQLKDESNREEREEMEDEEDYNEEDLDEEVIDSPPRKSKVKATKGDAKIEEHLRQKSQEELLNLLIGFTKRFPEIAEEFRERISLGEGDVERLVAQTRKEIRAVTSEIGWSNHWSDEGHTPDYSKIKHRFERLVELGHSDRVVELGRDFIHQAMRQVAESNDEGETAEAVQNSLGILFEAVNKSTLSGAKKLLFAIDACLEDDYDVVSKAADLILEAEWSKEDWSEVADHLQARLEQQSGQGEGSFHRDYHRQAIASWLGDALENAGRPDELLSIYEREARATKSYEKLVRYLLAEKREEDAHRWAMEGIAKTIDMLPGIASQLASLLSEHASKHKQPAVATAWSACTFFERPSLHGLQELLNACKKAKCEESVRAIALSFFETGKMPFDVKTARGKPSVIEVDSRWPLPVPDFCEPFLHKIVSANTTARPHYELLLELAIQEKRPDDVLHWYDKMPSGKKTAFGHSSYYGGSYSDRVAAAVVDAYS